MLRDIVTAPLVGVVPFASTLKNSFAQIRTRTVATKELAIETLGAVSVPRITMDRRVPYQGVLVDRVRLVYARTMELVEKRVRSVFVLLDGQETIVK